MNCADRCFLAIGTEILLEIYFPAALALVASLLKWLGLLLVVLVAVACIALVLYLCIVLIKRLLVPIYQRLSGAIAFSILLILYACAAHCLQPSSRPCVIEILYTRE